MTDEACPFCQRPYAVVGRVHRCVPVQTATIAAPEVLAAQQTLNDEKMAAIDSLLRKADRSRTKTIKWHAARDRRPVKREPGKEPKRDRAKYMRAYRAIRRYAEAARGL